MKSLIDYMATPRALSYDELEELADKVIDEAGDIGMTYAHVVIHVDQCLKVLSEVKAHLEHKALASVLHQTIT